VQESGAQGAHSASSDHFIGPRQHVGRIYQADLLAGFQIDNQLEVM
jgi:hypothetical protein